MAASPLQLPAFPPAGPWDAYVLFILWLPFVIRLVILAKPMRQVINKLVARAMHSFSCACQEQSWFFAIDLVPALVGVTREVLLLRGNGDEVLHADAIRAIVKLEYQCFAFIRPINTR